jgi:hypothetical protein
MDNNEYQKKLSDALDARRKWLEKTELVRFKEEFRTFHRATLGIYNLLLKKGLIHEDPYKQEAKMGEIEIPAADPFSEAERKEQMSIRLSEYDNQLDFLVNFYQFSMDFLTLDKIKKILALVKYIDWLHINNESPSANTRAMADYLFQIKTGGDNMALSVINDAVGDLNKATSSILALLKEISDFNREDYKLQLRINLTSNLPAAEATAANIRKKFPAAMPRTPFYPDLVEELIKEDYSKDGSALQERVLKSLQIPDTKPKSEKAPVSIKSIIIDGLLAIGSVASTLAEIGPKFDENAALLANRKKNFWQKLKRLMQQMMNKEPEPTIYTVEYIDTVKGVSTREKVNYAGFRGEMDRKARNLTGILRSGSAKLESMQDEQLLSLLDRSIRETQSLHKTLAALDDFFKLEASSQDDRDKVKGIKPELGTMKNAIIKANQKRHEYSAQKEEEEQLKRLGLGVNS